MTDKNLMSITAKEEGSWNMRILIITIIYIPEISGAAHLASELALSLKARGHDVTVLTGYPSYHLEVIPPRYRKGIYMSEDVDGITVRRIRFLPFPLNNKIARGLQHFMFSLWLGVMKCLTPRADVALVISPPLPLPWLIGWIGKIRRMPTIVNIQDLFPREAVELGMLSNKVLIRLFELMERQMHRLAAGVTVHSPGNKEHVIRHGGQKERVHVVYNWVDTERIRPSQRTNGFAHQHGLEGRFVVSYAGTMGWAQDMDTILDSAERLRNHRNILFLMVGDGVQKENAIARCRRLGLDNILWLPIQPWTVYPEILSASNVSLVNLHPELRTPVVPSKLLNIMAAARPVVASLPMESDARRIVTDADCGICVDAGDGQALAQAIEALSMDPEMAEGMGQRAREYAKTHFAREVCIDKMEKIFKHTIGGTK